MFALDTTAVFWCAVAIQLVGLLAVVMIRLTEGRSIHVLCQRWFYVCLVLVGAMTMVTLALSTGYWPFCGTTLSAMVLGVTLDPGDSRRATAL